MCCTFCYYENLHSGHKLIKLSDIDSLQKENITIESSTKNIIEISKKITNLKNKIEEEINKVNDLYEKTIKDLTLSYEKKHELLLIEENNLKEKLQNEVTKTKENLEFFLSESNKEIKMYERINKGIKKVENEEKNTIKVLSYVSKINKVQKNMKQLLSKLMKNINFSYEQEKNNIKYDEYYFNGIQIPKNIEFKDISPSKINISWAVDDINIINIDNNKIKYKVEMRKENENFKEIYEGNNTYYSINNLVKNTNYELRICSIYNDLIGEWTKIHKIKTVDDNLDINNIILNDNSEFLKFKFKKGKNYTLNNNDLIATKTDGGNNWNCSVIGDIEIPNFKISKWKIKINNISENCNNLWNILIGIGPDNINNDINFQRNCWSLICGRSPSKLNLQSKEKSYNEHQKKLKNGDIIEVIVDRKLGNLSFAINGKNYGIACNSIPKEDKLYPVINLYDLNNSIEILN